MSVTHTKGDSQASINLSKGQEIVMARRVFLAMGIG